MVVKIKPSSCQYSLHRVNKTHEHKTIVQPGETDFCSVQVGYYDEADLTPKIKKTQPKANEMSEQVNNYQGGFTPSN